jgi:hypothetical protein
MIKNIRWHSAIVHGIIGALVARDVSDNLLIQVVVILIVITVLTITDTSEE